MLIQLYTTKLTRKKIIIRVLSKLQLELDENNYFENQIKVNVLALRESMEKLNKPANRTEWEMTPPMVNAYYTPTKNQIGKTRIDRKRPTPKLPLSPPLFIPPNIGTSLL